MPGNSFGQSFRVTTFGESHGRGLGAIVDGCPPGLELSAEDLAPDLARRRPGQSRYTTQRKESDAVEIHSGVFEGRTTGTAIGLYVPNTDQKSKDYSDIADVFRPAHADYTYQAKYGHRDYRGGGRASARETVMRVAAGAIAKKYLAQQFQMQIRGYLAAVGDLQLPLEDWAEVENNDFFCGAPDRIGDIAALIDEVRKAGDSIGAEVRVVASNVPAGLGEPVFDKLDAEIAGAMMGINAVKAVGIGDGFDVVSQRGTQHRDEMDANGFLSNHAGGVLGGISSGQDIKVSLALKPTSSLTTPGRSQNVAGEEISVVTKGRHDPCVGIRAVPIAEAMLAIVLMDHVLRMQGQNPQGLSANT